MQTSMQISVQVQADVKVEEKGEELEGGKGQVLLGHHKKKMLHAWTKVQVLIKVEVKAEGQAQELREDQDRQ